ncbi:MAG: MFS transporter, partial [Treponema sp.]|nr:MFS transporter [Treponema sp.]
MAGKTAVVRGEVKLSEIIGHAVAGIGQNLIFGLWSGYMLVFFTDVFGIAGGVAGIIMMLTRIWDAVNDPMMGMIADRTRTRWGRYRPWLLFMALPVVVFLALNFSAP